MTPGSLTVSRGEFVDVSAEVRGLGDDDAVRAALHDGRWPGRRQTDSDEAAPATGCDMRAALADEADGSATSWFDAEASRIGSKPATLARSTMRSRWFRRRRFWSSASTTTIRRTRATSIERVDGLGDIRAIEGTRMTIHARANGAIREADVDFDADGRPDLRMTANGNEAERIVRAWSARGSANAAACELRVAIYE